MDEVEKGAAALLDSVDREYNRKTNAMIERHATALRTLSTKLAEVTAERDVLREAHAKLREGYMDAAAGLAYVRQYYGRLDGVGFDRVADTFFDLVTMREREGLLAGSSVLPLTQKGPDDGRG